MSLFLAMLPIYIFGNFHCLGMCGPLVMMIGHHRYRYWYFLGRTFSFAIAGLIAGTIGEVVGAVFQQFHLGILTSILFGGILIILGVFTFAGWNYPGHAFLGRRLAKTNQYLSLLLLKDQAISTFLFGFFTILLPCGQTLIVFSACAVFGEPFIGFMNGAAFALLTSPSLFLSMQAHSILRHAKHYYQPVIGILAILVGSLSIFRGLAEAGWISHLTVPILSSDSLHVVIF